MAAETRTGRETGAAAGMAGGGAAPVAVVTGASSGIGRATALRLLREGWHVAAIARRGDKLANLAPAARGRLLPLAADVTVEGQLRDAVAEIRSWRAGVHALATCAGDFFARPIAATSTEEFERIWRLLVQAKFVLVRELLPLLELGAGEKGAATRAIIHVASLAAHHDFPDESAYGSAMHGVVGLARSQDAELRERGIRAAVYSPGLVRTPLTERSFPARALEGALTPDAAAGMIFQLMETIRSGGYVPEIFHVPGRSR